MTRSKRVCMLRTFRILRWMKNLGYPETMTSTTRFSPSSYPTLSAHVGNETEIACGVKAGTGAPKGTGASNDGAEDIVAGVECERCRGERLLYPPSCK